MHIGLYAYFLELSKTGYEADYDNLTNIISNYPLCIIYGSEPMKYKKDIAYLCKNVQKYNPETQFVIKTNGYIYPSGLTSLKNVSYDITLQLKKSGVNYNDRINEKTLLWYSKNGARIIVDVEDDDDFDELEQIRNDVGSKKSLFYINIKSYNPKHYKNCFHNGYNIYMSMEGEFY